MDILLIFFLPGKISYQEVGGLSEQIRKMREVIELPLTNPELFKRVSSTALQREIQFIDL